MESAHINGLVGVKSVVRGEQKSIWREIQGDRLLFKYDQQSGSMSTVPLLIVANFYCAQ